MLQESQCLDGLNTSIRFVLRKLKRLSLEQLKVFGEVTLGRSFIEHAVEPRPCQRPIKKSLNFELV
jgi:hypothetical protein